MLRPRTRFVSEFIGEINLFTGEWRDGAFISNGTVLPACVNVQFGKATIAIRPERIRLTEADETSLNGRVQTSTFVSGQMVYRIALDDGSEVAVKNAETAAVRPIGTRVGLNWTPADVVVVSD